MAKMKEKMEHMKKEMKEHKPEKKATAHKKEHGKMGLKAKIGGK